MGYPIDTRYEEHAIAGQERIVDTAAHTGNFTGLLVIATAVVSAMDWETDYETAANDWTGYTNLPAGYYPGRFKSITLASGQAMAIRRGRTP